MAAPYQKPVLATSSSSLLPNPYTRANDSSTSLDADLRYGTAPGRASSAASISEKYSLSPDPNSWGANLSPNHAEPDDYLHNPDPKRDTKFDGGGSILTYRGITNLGCLLVLAMGMMTLFAGYPIISHFTSSDQTTQGGFNLGGTNASGQVPDIGNFGLIDTDTPTDAYTKASYETGEEWQLVFSDEFNEDGRTFYPGEDPYWEAVDLHYWGTNNMEWYDPAAITTKGGNLLISLTDHAEHGLDYRGGMMSTWNKFCFTGGLIETSVQLPGSTDVLGLWPAVWAMGNLGRAGYGASLDGTWPYTYDACDVGTVANQTVDGVPHDATVDGDPGNNNALSYLPGQRLSRCTCPGESHPGPIHSDGTYVGRAAPEIDIFEAQVGGGQGHVSQSGQWAPFNYAYTWFNETDAYDIPDPTVTELNSYKGGAFQQATSGVSKTNQGCYQFGGTDCFAIYGFEYKPGFETGYITWINDGKAAWTVRSRGMRADTRVEIAERPVPQEPMYILANLGMSRNFGEVDLDNLVFPAIMKVDYVRVYQPKNAINLGCDPEDFPTKAYIEEYAEAYANPNLTTWVDDYKQPFPKNSFLGEC
ncbi:glycoside hydrolase family 16 protein [Cylindrobasidium torrendii FP15055 ss-10]|uniref:Glycoside hydrolase family 16 protein n=1 Tax=Cylindrobasidium torrendii FP15055 ss-10 TaxID=1314674 RepID=A0A0D7BHX1_9AGAR|nr:glycoside hydrolase family 16 protein [Cylindrobasidium torrendii FP15055 ss-10]